MKNKNFAPELQDFLIEGLSFSQACLAMEAYYSCAIEGIALSKKEFKKLCKKIRENK